MLSATVLLFILAMVLPLPYDEHLDDDDAQPRGLD